MKFIRQIILFAICGGILILVSSSACNKKGNGGGSNPTPDPVPATNDVSLWMTTADQSSLLQKQPVILGFGSITNSYPFIDVDESQTFQTIDGFGYTLTSGSASLINSLASSARTALLRELFSNDDNAIGVSYLRISIGASDLSANVYSYDDMPAGQTDASLANFSLGL